MPRPRATSLTINNPRRGLIPGGSEQLKRYKILRRQQIRTLGLNRNNSTNRHAGSDEESSNSDHSLDLDPDVEMQNVVDLCRIYANELYLPLREKHPTNLVYSPLGYCLSTVLLHRSCTGPCQRELSQAVFTSAEVSKCLQNDASQRDTNNSIIICSEVITGLTALLESIRESSDAFCFEHAYKFYLDSDHKPRLSFLDKVKTIHHGKIELESIDFSVEAWRDTSHTINKWAHAAGQNMLGEMVTRRSANTKIIFVNPIYFMGNWVHPFNPAETKEMKFFVSDRDSVNVPMMQSGLLKNLLFAPINKLACQALVLPFKGDHLSLVIFLPNERAGLGVIEAALETILPSNYFQDMYNYRKKMATNAGFKVYLPRFKIDCTIDLQGPMKELGVDSIFQPGKADFSGLSRNAPKELSIAQILQKVVIDVNELGSTKLPNWPIIMIHLERFKEANAAPTEDKEAILSKNQNKGDIIEYRVDHPFFFQVVDIKSDLIVLTGVCRNPIHGKGLGIREFLEKYDITVPAKPQGSPTVSLGHIKTRGTRTK